jgi:FMN phosphatase YigB (HAD superfamily)
MTERHHFGAVVFDLDDTLYPCSQYLKCGMAAVARYIHAVYGFRIPEPPIKENSRSWEALLLELCRNQLNSIDNRLEWRVKHVFLTHIPKLNLHIDARTVLSFLRASNIKTGVLAPGPSHAQRTKVRSLQLAEITDFISYPDELAGTNPLMDSLLTMEMMLDTPVDRILLAGNMATTDYSPFIDCKATLLALDCNNPNPASLQLAERSQLRIVSSLLEICHFVKTGEVII